MQPDSDDMNIEDALAAALKFDPPTIHALDITVVPRPGNTVELVLTGAVPAVFGIFQRELQPVLDQLLAIERTKRAAETMQSEKN